MEYDWSNYHLEYVEIARKEFLKRNLRNDVDTEQIEEKVTSANDNKYPALKILIGVYEVIAWLVAIGGVIVGFYFFAQDVVLIGIAYIIIGDIFAIMFYTKSESLKLLKDIEYNTRKALE